jgi:hypothetical protein
MLAVQQGLGDRPNLTIHWETPLNMAAALSTKSTAGLSARATRSTPRARVVCAAAGRTTWLPNVTPPKYLDGSLAGDFGFDPLGLGADPQRLKWCVPSLAEQAVMLYAGDMSAVLLSDY